MAFMDHTAHARPWVHQQPKSKPRLPSGSTLDALYDARVRRRTCNPHLADAAPATSVMEGLLKSHHALEQARTANKRIGLLLLNAVHSAGLQVATNLLHDHVDTHTPGSGG